MKISIHIPTVQFGFILAEGEDKDLPEMIKLHNLYSPQKITPQKVREVNKYKDLSKNYDHLGNPLNNK